MGAEASTVIAQPPEQELLCLRCGYDLRGAAGEKCSECGWEIDRELLSGGFFPWERRRYRGRFISYIKTVWQVSIGSRTLRNAVEKRHALADAIVFAQVTGVIVALVLIGLLLLLIRNPKGWALLIEPQSAWPEQDPRPPWVDSMGIPWSAAMTLLPLGGSVLPVAMAMLIAFAFYAARAPRHLFKLRGEDGTAAESAEAIGCYATAFLVWLLPGAILLTTLWQIDDAPDQDVVVPILLISATAVALLGLLVRLKHAIMRTHASFWFMPAMLLLGTKLGLIAYALTLLVDYDLTPAKGWVPVFAVGLGAVFLMAAAQVLQWLVRVRKVRKASLLLSSLHLLWLWLWGVIFFLGIVPWCIGYVWIAVDSFL